MRLRAETIAIVVIMGMVFSLGAPSSGMAQTVPCPAAKSIPQLTIDSIENPMVPVLEKWQVFLEGVPLSDIQVAQLANDEKMIELANRRMSRRGKWVFWSLASATVGIGISATGWVLFGKNELSRGVTLSMALGGVLVGVGSVLLATEAIQMSLEPYVAPSPTHSISRSEMRELVARINHRFYKQVCSASQDILNQTLGRPALLSSPPTVK